MNSVATDRRTEFIDECFSSPASDREACRRALNALGYTRIANIIFLDIFIVLSLSIHTVLLIKKIIK
jgi:hypothetical protein